MAPKRPASQICEPERVRIARRPRRRMARDMGAGLLELVDEPQAKLRGGFDPVVVDGFLHVPVGKPPWDDALHDSNAPAARLPIRSRSVAKYALSAPAAAALQPEPHRDGAGGPTQRPGMIGANRSRKRPA